MNNITHLTGLPPEFYASQRILIQFTEVPIDDKAVCLQRPDGQQVIAIHYDMAYKMIFSLNGGVCDENVRACCSVAMQRVMANVESKIKRAL